MGQSETFFHLAHREILNSPNLQNGDWGLVRHRVCGHFHLLLYLCCQLCEGVGRPSGGDQQLTLHLLHLLYLHLYLVYQDLPELHTELRSSSYSTTISIWMILREIKISLHSSLAISLCSTIKLPSSFCLNRNLEIK